MGIFNDRGENNTVEQGIKGEKGDPGIGFLLDSNNNYNIQNIKLTNVKEPTDDKDAVNKKFLDKIPGVSLTRSIRLANGLFLEGMRIDGLPNPPPSLTSATSKEYVRSCVDGKDTAIREYVNQGDMYRAISTKNEFNFVPSDFRDDSNFSVFNYDQYRDFASKYHNAKAHVLCSLSKTPANLSITLRSLKRGIYGFRIEGIVDPKDDTSNFDLTIRTPNTDLIISKTRYKDKIDFNTIIIDIEFELKVDIKQLLIILTLTHVLNKEIALFIYGRRGAGHVDPMIIDNVDYSKVVEQQFLPLLQSNLFNIIPDVLYEQFVNKFCTTLYKIDRASSSEVIYETKGNSKHISKLCDQTRFQITAVQSTSNLKPILEHTGPIIDYRYSIKFTEGDRLTANINLNAPIVNVFVVYSLNTFKSSISIYGQNALFGNDDGRNNGRYITFNSSKSLIVAGSNSGRDIVNSYPNNANAGELNKYKVLSVHFNQPSEINKSYIYCNGKKLLDFTSNSTKGTSTTTIGDLSDIKRAPLRGNIAFFSVYKNILSKQTIKLHHKILCERYNVTHDSITLD